MTHYVVREMINSSWAVSSFAIVLVLAIYVWRKAQVDGFYNDTSTKLAIAFLCYHIGSSIYRAWVTVVLWVEAGHTSVFDPRDQIWIGVCAAIVALLGALCVIRICTPVMWPRWKVQLPWFCTYLIAMSVASFIGYLELR